MGNNIRRQNRRKTKRETTVKVSHDKMRVPPNDGLYQVSKLEKEG